MSIGICLSSISLFAQKNIDLKGRLTNRQANDLVVYNFSQRDLMGAPASHKATLDDSGRFELKIPVKDEYSWITIAHGKSAFTLLMPASSEWNLQAAGSLADTLIYLKSPTHKAMAAFQEKSIHERGGLIKRPMVAQQMLGLGPADFTKVVDSLWAVDLKFLQDNKAGLAPKFIGYWETYLKYDSYVSLLSYPAFHEMVKQQRMDVKAPLENYSEIEKVPAAFDDKALSIPPYQNYALEYYRTRLAAAGLADYVDDNPNEITFQLTDSMLKLVRGIPAQKTKELVAGQVILMGVKRWPVPLLQSVFEKYKADYPKSTYTKELAEAIADLVRFEPGQPAVDFAFKTLDGQDRKLSDFKGKVVYLDFWASWCGPCKGEMPHAKKIKEQLNGKDVVFLYVSIDENVEAWKKGIESMEISGVHTQTPGWSGEIAKKYNISGVPSYFLIDKKGRFASKRAPRPSQGEVLLGEINRLLAE